MSGRVRKAALTTHVVASVGWTGAVACFLAMAIAGLAGDAELARGAYVTMEFIAWAVIVPLSVASLVSGLVQGLGTTWGVFRHYWVVAKLVLNLVAAVVLLLYMDSVGFLADLASEEALFDDRHDAVRVQALVHSGAALMILLTATALSVFKPKGVTPYGWPKQQQSRISRS